jgi:hypothetical protein
MNKIAGLLVVSQGAGSSVGGISACFYIVDS